jgi:uncharacterized protein (TIGR00255 family)
MALVSMTGFGRGAASANGMKVEVELSSVNRRQFDVRISLPRGLFALEPQVNTLIHAAIARGAVTGTVKVTAAGETKRRGIAVDSDAAAAYLLALRRTARKLGLKDDFTAASLLAMPEVMQYQDVTENSAQVWRVLEKALKSAVKRLTVMRRREGATLDRDVARRIERLKTVLSEVKGLAPAAMQRYAEALTARLAKAGIGLDMNDPHLLKEIALFADRSDISEEVVRLESHLRQAAQLLASAEPVGRTLDFLCQEMFREINTIGSKANDAAIARCVVGFKTELECIREQVQNVE